MPSWSGELFAPAGFNKPPIRAAAGLEPRPCGAAAARRDAAAAVGGVPAEHAGRLRLQPVLRSLHRVAPRRLARRCARPMAPARSCSSTYAGDTVPVFDAGDRRGAARPTSSSRCWAPPTTPMRKPAGARGWPTGSAPTSTRWRSSAACRSCWSATTCKAGVTAACRYEPGINRTYQDLAAHYGTAILPTRSAQAARQGQGRSGGADRRALHPGAAAQPPLLLARRAERGDPRVLGDLNARLMRKLGASRREFFETIDRPALMPLPPRTLSVCRMAELPGRPRLPRRGAGPLLLGAVAADPRGGRGAHHRHDDRGLPRGAACREPCRARR